MPFPDCTRPGRWSGCPDQNPFDRGTNMVRLMAVRPSVRAIPATMKAAAIDRFGPPDVLEVREVPTPQPGPGEVLIAIHTAGIGVWDGDIRAGWGPAGKPKFPLVLGADSAGVVAAKGPRVHRFKPGDRGWAYEFS